MLLLLNGIRPVVRIFTTAGPTLSISPVKSGRLTTGAEATDGFATAKVNGKKTAAITTHNGLNKRNKLRVEKLLMVNKPRVQKAAVSLPY